MLVLRFLRWKQIPQRQATFHATAGKSPKYFLNTCADRSLLVTKQMLLRMVRTAFRLACLGA